MDRCHLYMPLVDASGVQYPYADVTLLDPGTGLPVDAPVYLQAVGGAPQPWPVLVSNPAVVNLWTDTPMRVTLQAQLPDGITLTRIGVDIVPPASNIVRTDRPLQIASTEGLDASAILSVSPIGTASWNVVNALQYHRHAGDSQDSTMVGMTTLTDIYPRQVWVGSAPGAASGSQGTDTVAIGGSAQVPGTAAVALGRATAGPSSVAIGPSALSGTSAVALGSTATAPGSGQVTVGEATNATAAVPRGVVIGSGTTAATGTQVHIAGKIKIYPDGSITLGSGTMPSTSGLTGSRFVTLLGRAVLPQYLRASRDVSLAGAASTFGAFGLVGTTRPILSSSGVTGSTPGQAAILSLLAALDQLGLIYLIDGAIDDELVDWSKTSTHDATLALDTGDASGFYAGDTTRIKRTTSAAAAVTYAVLASDIKDFTARVFSSSPVDITTEVLAWLSPNGTTWSPVTLAWQAQNTTVSPWVQTWCTNARPLPAGMHYLKLQLGVNAATAAPQIGRVIIRHL